MRILAHAITAVLIGTFIGTAEAARPKAADEAAEAARLLADAGPFPGWISGALETIRKRVQKLDKKVRLPPEGGRDVRYYRGVSHALWLGLEPSATLPLVCWRPGAIRSPRSTASLAASQD